MSQYDELLKDPEWKKLRNKILKRRGYKCEECGDTKSILNIHHGWYCKIVPWDYPDSCYHVLCDTCHIVRHHTDNRFKQITSKLKLHELQKLISQIQEEYPDKYEHSLSEVLDEIISELT